jgi:DNA replication and repair protein RecF
MLLSSIRLKNFRLHKDTQIDFAKKLNYIIGGNGQGKTSILESIYYLCTTKSFSTRSDAEAVNFDEEIFEISGMFENLTNQTTVVTYSSLDNRKNYLLNEKKISRHSEVIGKFPVVLLTPTDHSITQGMPADRRRFVDSVISQASETYLQILMEYNRILKQRSYLLSAMKERPGQYYDELEAWNEKLIQNGSEIISHRKKFINEFNQYVKDSYFKVMEDYEVPSLRYSTLEDYEGENIKETFSSLVKEREKEELRRATNLVGPQRDDVVFNINGLNLKIYGSQGQHKTFQAALRFAEFYYLKEVTGTSPIFLLDDVFGELDANRAYKISEYLGEVGQAFITLTDFGNFEFLKVSDMDKVIKLKNGIMNYA